MMKKLFKIFFIIFLANFNNLYADEKIGSQHQYGISLLGSYEYEETQLMHLRGGLQAESKKHENYGLLYNYKNSFINNGYFTEFEFDNSYQFMNQSYWSNTTGTMKDIDVDIFNSRLLYGLNISEKLMLKSGLGYRYLYHHWENRKSSTGGNGYDREQDYTYIPIIAELKAPIPELAVDGILKIEFDNVIAGQNNSYLGYLGGSNRDLEFTNDDGYMWKISYEANMSNYIIEPYYEFMSIEESTSTSSSQEPSNTTKEIGIRFKTAFNTNNNSKVSNYKTLRNDDKYYFGIQLLMSEVEIGLFNPSGTGQIDDKDGYGYSLISGTSLTDFLDLEFAFNQFNQSQFTCNNGDTVITDGRYNKGANPYGTTLTCGSDNTAVIIESYSTAIGIKPKFEFSLNDLDIAFNLSAGYHRWDQSETTVVAGSSTTVVDLTGHDPYFGLGIFTTNDNLSFSLSYLQHDMFYNAKSLGASVNYIF